MSSIVLTSNKPIRIQAANRADRSPHAVAAAGKWLTARTRSFRIEASLLVRQCVAITIICLTAVVSRFALSTNEYSLLLAAIAVTSWCCGRGPALLATFTAMLIASGLLAQTEPSLQAESTRGLPLIIFFLEACLVNWLIGLQPLNRSKWDALTTANHREGMAWEIDDRRMVEGVKGCAILLVDETGRIASWTDAAERMTGFTSEKIIGMPLSLFDVDVANSGVMFRRAMEVAKTGGIGALQTRCSRKNGTEFWADIVIGVVTNDRGDLAGYSVVIRDVTTRKQAEELLEQRSRQLVEASRLKDEFLATISHELRTPLNSILGWTQLFRAGKLDDSGKSHALETIEQSAKTQARLIEDLLDVSRIVTGKMRLEVRSIQMSDVIQAAVQTIRPAAEAKNISLQVILESASCSVFGDPNRLQQVLWNLLSNAIKFTPQDGSVQIILRRENSLVQVQVKDNGSGIPAEFLPYVFDAFRQADSSSTRSHKGLGLGLTIVRRLIELHGGTVRAESPGEGGGTTIELSLPAVSTSKSSPVISTVNAESKPSGATVNSKHSPEAAHNRRVLCVDDDNESRDLITTVLSHHGIHVEVAATAAEGLEATKRLLPDVLVSDIEMPEQDGYMFIHEVRALDAECGGRTPAIALTAYTRAEDRSRSLAAGFQMHLAKPVDAEELINAIIALSNSRRKGPGHAQTARH